TFAAVRDDRSKWLSGYRKLIRLVSAAAFPLFWGAAALAPAAIPLVLGSKWSATVWPFILLCLSVPFRMVFSLTTTALLAAGRADVSFAVAALWAAVLSPLFWLGAKFGLQGVAVAWAAGFPLVYVLSLTVIARAMNVPFTTLMQPIVSPAAAGGLA